MLAAHLPERAAYARHIDDTAGGASADQRQKRLRQRDRAEEVDVEDGAQHALGNSRCTISIDATAYNRARLSALALEHHLPSMFGFRAGAEAGGLLSYGPDLNAEFRRCRVYVDKIIKGAKPSELPVEQTSIFVLTINLQTAKALRLTIPPSLLARADEVIE